MPLYACLFVICATISTSSLLANRSEVVPERSRFVAFPATIGEWQGHTSLLEPQIEQWLGLEDYLLSDYRNSAGKVVNYMLPTILRNEQENHHSPLVCIPADGWSITRFERTSYGAGHPLNRAIIERNGSKQLVYYWYAERGRKIASEYWSKWYLLHDAITQNRSDGALVRMITPILPNEVERDADDRLRQFIHDLGTSLNAFIAAGDLQKAITVGQTPDRRS